MKHLSSSQLMSDLKAADAKHTAERSARSKIGMLRDELRQAVFHSGMDEGIGVRFFNETIRAAAAAGRLQEGAAVFTTEQNFLSDAISEVRKQASAGAGHNTQVPSYTPAPVARVTAPAVSSGPGVPPALAPAVAASTPRAAVAPPNSPVAWPAANAAVVPSAHPMSATAAPSLPQLNQIATRVFGREFPQDVNRQDHAAMQAAVERLAFESHLVLPGMDQAVLGGKFPRVAADQIVGALAAERDSRQASVNAIIAGTPNLTKYLSMDTNGRRGFVEQGGKLTRSEFDALSPRLRKEYACAGGRLIDDLPEDTRTDKNPAAGKSISRATFESMTPMAKSAWCRSGGRLHD